MSSVPINLAELVADIRFAAGAYNGHFYLPGIAAPENYGVILHRAVASLSTEITG